MSLQNLEKEYDLLIATGNKKLAYKFTEQNEQNYVMNDEFGLMQFLQTFFSLRNENMKKRINEKIKEEKEKLLSNALEDLINMGLTEDQLDLPELRFDNTNLGSLDTEGFYNFKTDTRKLIHVSTNF